MTAGNVPNATDPETPFEWATLFGSYLENYGRHHGWCLVFQPKNAPGGLCNCGYEEAIDAVGVFHTMPQLGVSEYESMVRYWSSRGGR